MIELVEHTDGITHDVEAEIVIFAVRFERLRIFPDTTMKRFVSVVGNPTLFQQMAEFFHAIGMQAIKRRLGLSRLNIALDTCNKFFKSRVASKSFNPVRPWSLARPLDL